MPFDQDIIIRGLHGGKILDIGFFPGDALLNLLSGGFFAKGETIISGKFVETHDNYIKQNRNLDIQPSELTHQDFMLVQFDDRHRSKGSTWSSVEFRPAGKMMDQFLVRFARHLFGRSGKRTKLYLDRFPIEDGNVITRIFFGVNAKRLEVFDLGFHKLWIAQNEN